MAKQIISLIVIFAMVSLYPANLLAQETDSAPKLTDVKEGDIVPFDGVLLNSRAAIQMLAYKRNAALDCKINTDYELEKQKAKNVLLNDSIRLSLDSANMKYKSIIEIKERASRRNKMGIRRGGGRSARYQRSFFSKEIAMETTTLRNETTTVNQSSYALSASIDTAIASMATVQGLNGQIQYNLSGSQSNTSMMYDVTTGFMGCGFIPLQVRGSDHPKSNQSH